LSFCAIGQNANFNYSAIGGSFCSPTTVKFINQSSGNPIGYLWEFGNGQRSNSANPTTTFNNAGNYQVKLTTVYSNTASTIIKQVTIYANPTISLSMSSSQMCMPGEVSFQVTNSDPGSTFSWNFGDNSPVMITTVPNVNHSFSNFGNLNISVVCTNTNGCKSTDTKELKIIEPILNSSILFNNGCIPINNVFTSSVSIPSSPNVIANYSWNFGDGNMLNTTDTFANHTYNQVGAFEPSLTVTTPEGCTITKIFDSIRFGTPPISINAYPSDTVFCASYTPFFVAHSDANEYEWRFGNEGVVKTIDTVITHQFKSLGVKLITVTPLQNGCRSLINQSFNVRVIGTIARYNFKNTCAEKSRFSFLNTSLFYSSTSRIKYNWDFGDNTPFSNVKNPIHTYPPTGLYYPTLIIFDTTTNCSDTLKTRLVTTLPVLTNPDSFVCKNSNTTFHVENTYGMPAQYNWHLFDVNQGITTDTFKSYNPTIFGYYNNNHVIVNRGAIYCKDTVLLGRTLPVIGPRVEFTIPQEICLNIALTSNNQTSSFRTDEQVNMYQWSIDNVFNNNGYNLVPYLFSNAGVYDIKLKTTDTKGCTDSLIKTVNVKPLPFSWTLPKYDTICLGQTTQLIAHTSDNVLWSSSIPVTAFCNTCDSTVVSPLHSTTYFVSSTNSYGCTVKDSSFVQVFEPFNILTPFSDSGICLNNRIEIHLEPSDKKVQWIPNSFLTTDHSSNTISSPTTSTRYKIMMTDSMGCFNNQKEIYIRVNPLPVAELGEDKYISLNTTLQLNPTFSNNIREIIWQPAHLLSCINCPNPIANIEGEKNTYYIKTISDSNCIFRDTMHIFLMCDQANLMMPNAFTPNNDGLNDVFYPISKGIRLINKFSIYNRYNKLIFERKNFNPNYRQMGWDGKSNQQLLDADTYIYTIEATCNYGKIINKKGTVILIR
jgi:gliding motility-associated-like protein